MHNLYGNKNKENNDTTTTSPGPSQVKTPKIITTHKYHMFTPVGALRTVPLLTHSLVVCTDILTAILHTCTLIFSYSQGEYNIILCIYLLTLTSSTPGNVLPC